MNQQKAPRRLAGLGIAALVLGLAGCAGTGGPVEKWHMTDGAAPQAAQPLPGPRQPVAVVFYREAEGARASQPINVYVNGQYQASLVGNTYTEQSLCPGQHTLAVHFNDVVQRYRTKLQGQPARVDQRPMQYFKVAEGADGQASIVPMPADQVGGKIAALQHRQTHTLRRVTRNGCAAS
ncbi:MAG: hypothetical protein QM772_16400 [Ottowia sp.]|uniref:hypothetical protein n=1 Tax=Ottowia sp. TaxID=1898956 RepID=UPI0039E6BB9A